MQNICGFWALIFWISFMGFLINSSSFLNLLLYSELVWVVIYCLYISYGVINDNITIITSSFLILGFASVEFSLGYLLIILFKNFNKTINLNELDFLWLNFMYKNNSKFILNKNWKVL